MAGHRSDFAGDNHVQAVRPDRVVAQVGADCQPVTRYTLEGVAAEAPLGEAIAGILGDADGDECDVAFFIFDDEDNAVVIMRPFIG